MLILKETIKAKKSCIEISCSPKWYETDTYIMVECVLSKLKKILTNAKEDSKQVIMICSCSEQAELPPVRNMLQIVKFMLSINNLLKVALNYTILLCLENTNQELWITRILSIYTPVRPVYIAHNETEIMNILQIY